MNAGVDTTLTTGTGESLSYRAWVALAAAIAAGGALGLWCRSTVHESVPGLGHAEGVRWVQSFNAAMADLGSPWLLTAFAVGAVSARARRHRHTIALAALSGAAALVSATLVYYGTADQGSGVFRGARSFGAVWVVTSTVIGATVAIAGALWWPNRKHVLGLVAVVGLGALVAGEALFYLRQQGFTGFTATDRARMAVATLGVLLPLVLLPRWRAALIGVFGVAVLTWPTSVVLGRMLMLVFNSIGN